MSTLTYVFVHGLSGWGSYDPAYRRMPYWGMRGGNLMGYLQQESFSCKAASVAPTGSAWDRACELYAQIAGTQVDYGEAHSKTYGHERFGRDFSAEPLLPRWGEDTRLVLLGHSFGGVTARLFAELLANGDAAEREATDPENLSPLFKGGMGSRVHAVVTLSAPTNGTTAYDLFEDASFDANVIKVPWWSRGLARMMSWGTSPSHDGRDKRDYADYDMHIDRAMEINERIETRPDVYYLSVPCSATTRQPDGTHVPKAGIEPLFVQRAYQIGAYTGKTAKGVELGEEWRENDGLVNTISARAPHNAPSKPLGDGGLEPGVWNVLPTVDGDHMWLQGGLTHTHDIRGFYIDLLRMIDATA